MREDAHCFFVFVYLFICSAADTWTDGITRWHRVHIHTDSAGKIGETLRSCGWILGEAGKVYIYLSIFISPLVRSYPSAQGDCSRNYCNPGSRWGNGSGKDDV